MSKIFLFHKKINQRLKNLRLVKLKPKLQRAQSVPNVSSNNMTGSNLYDDEMFFSVNPSTPHLISGNIINNTSNNVNSSNKNSYNILYINDKEEMLHKCTGLKSYAVSCIAFYSNAQPENSRVYDDIGITHRHKRWANCDIQN